MLIIFDMPKKKRKYVPVIPLFHLKIDTSSCGFHSRSLRKKSDTRLAVNPSPIYIICVGKMKHIPSWLPPTRLLPLGVDC